MAETDKAERFLGLDFLRILSMFMIVTLHVLGSGGVLPGAAEGSAQFAWAWLLESAAFCAVNCYGLVSGYVGYKSGHKISSLAVLWLEVFAYSVLITLGIWLRVPASVTAKDWLHAFLPVTFRQYWYFTAYFGLFIFKPILNAAIDGLSRKQMSVFFAGAVVFFMTATCLAQFDSFYISNGYSMVWLSILYLFGAFLRKYGVPETVKKKTAAALYAVSVLLCWLVRLLGSDILLKYTSPLVFLSGLSLFVVFEKTQFHSSFMKRLIMLFAPATFGVYLIHNHLLLNKYYVAIRFAFLAEKSTPILICGVLGFALAIYIGCTAVDLVRKKIFDLLHIKQLLKPLDRLYLPSGQE